jgi:hypothetical protein
VVGGGHDLRQAVGWNDDDTVVVPENDVTRADDYPADLDWAAMTNDHRARRGVDRPEAGGEDWKPHVNDA